MSFLISKNDSQRYRTNDRHRKSPTVKYWRLSFGIASDRDPLYVSLRNKVGSYRVFCTGVSYWQISALAMAYLRRHYVEIPDNFLKSHVPLMA